MVKIVTLIALAITVTSVAAEKTRYDNYKVYHLIPTTSAHLEYLKSFDEAYDGYSFWNGPTRVNASVDLMVAPNSISQFEQLMNDIQLPVTTYIENVQELIDNENVVPKDQARNSKFGWTNYHTLEEIYAWLDSLAAQYPNNVEIIVGGSTFEGRQIKGVKLSYAKGNPGIFIEGGIHAREWISPATVTYIINELLTSNNRDIRALAESHDWYIFPVFNPDGFVYTHTNMRLWRKTRSRNNVFCAGADPNRNWAYQWMNGGASNNPCLDTFAGSAPFSEIETRTMSEYITSIKDKFYAYISFHSFTQLLLLPYGHTTQHLDNYDELYAIGIKATESLKSRYGTIYRTGNVAETIYVATGGSMDWVKATFRTPITFTYELRDTGRYGFLLPANQIIPTGEETMDSLVTMFKETKARGYPKSN